METNRIKVNDDLKFTKSPGTAYSPDGICIGKIYSNEQLVDLQMQILLADVDGYYIKFRGYTIKISSDGELDDWSDDFLDRNRKMLFNLIKARSDKKKNAGENKL